jgi:hypothetical protein
MRRLFLIVPLWLLLMTLGLIGWNYFKHQPPSTNISDLQSQIDVLQTRIMILERHLDETGL